MARKLSFEVLLRTALVDSRNARTGEVSKSELARRIGVSRSTVTRWLAGATPKPETLQRVEKPLKRVYERVRDRAATQNRRSRAKLPRMAIPFVADRARIKQRDYQGKETGKLIYSDWVNIDVQHYTIDAIFDLLRGLRAQQEIIQIIYRVPRGGTSLGGREYRGGGRASTTPFEMNPRWTDSELWERTLGQLYEHKDKKKLSTMYIGVLRQITRPGDE